MNGQVFDSHTGRRTMWPPSASWPMAKPKTGVGEVQGLERRVHRSEGANHSARDAAEVALKNRLRQINDLHRLATTAVELWDG